DAASTIRMPTCIRQSQAALRSCGIPGDRGVMTLLPGFDGYPTEAPEIDYECFACGAFYEIPNQCSRVLDVLCRECYSTTVHAYPDEVPDFWPCAYPTDQCEDDAEVCGLGFKYTCIDEVWVLEARCEDPCCESDCIPADEAFSSELDDRGRAESAARARDEEDPPSEEDSPDSTDDDDE
ncbi:MAG: hypothetical protein VX589_11825, partial [Myxococcota bacterium]|nr:hypothetical protein [Myxococcota bacterium]